MSMLVTERWEIAGWRVESISNLYVWNPLFNKYFSVIIKFKFGSLSSLILWLLYQLNWTNISNSLMFTTFSPGIY